jgi:hypothetical protein
VRAKNRTPWIPAHLATYRCAAWALSEPGDELHMWDCLQGWTRWLCAIDVWAEENGINSDTPELDYRYEHSACVPDD